MKRRCFAFVLAALILLLPGCKGAQNSQTTTGNTPPTKTTVQTAAAPQTTTAAEISVDDLPIPQFDPATWQQNTEPVTMTFHSELTLPTEQFPDHPLWGEDPISRHIQNITGVKLVELEAEKSITLDAVLASGEWADFFHSAGVSANCPLEDSSICYGLDELAAEYCPDFWDDMDALELLNNTASDGHIYTLRADYNNNAVYSDENIPVYPKYSTVINTKWLEQIGADMPTSWKNWKNVL